jgi:xanthosine utilization system XapX-like protein
MPVECQGNRVAVKLLTVTSGSAMAPAARAMLRQEALIMCQLYHPCVAHVYGIVDEGEMQVGALAG